MPRFGGSSEKEKEVTLGVFRTLLVTQGIILHYEKQIERLSQDANQIGLKFTEPSLTPPWETSRLKIIVTEEGTFTQIAPYTPPQEKLLTLYPEPVEGDRIKTLAYADRDFIKKYALSVGCDDALVTTKEGYITETANANFFYEYEGEKVTADPSLPYLKGLTIDLLPGPMTYKKFTWDEIPREAKLFVCNSLMGVKPVKLLKNDHFHV